MISRRQSPADYPWSVLPFQESGDSQEHFIVICTRNSTIKFLFAAKYMYTEFSNLRQLMPSMLQHLPLSAASFVLRCLCYKTSCDVTRQHALDSTPVKVQYIDIQISSIFQRNKSMMSLLCDCINVLGLGLIFRDKLSILSPHWRQVLSSWSQQSAPCCC